MTERERNRIESTQDRTAPASTDENNEIESSRSRADRLLRAADAAIDRALSTDSERFLQQTRQQSGQ